MEAKPRSIKVHDEAWSLWKEEAKVRGVSATQLVHQAMEELLAPGEPAPDKNTSGGEPAREAFAELQPENRKEQIQGLVEQHNFKLQPEDEAQKLRIVTEKEWEKLRAEAKKKAGQGYEGKMSPPTDSVRLSSDGSASWMSGTKSEKSSPGSVGDGGEGSAISRLPVMGSTTVRTVEPLTREEEEELTKLIARADSTQGANLRRKAQLVKKKSAYEWWVKQQETAG